MNKAETRSLTLRAESGVSWTVASKPDWVTVSPMSGTGKVEVTVTVSALAKGAGNREGEIVYKLDGNDYSASTKVEQYDYQYGDGDVYTVQNHSKGRGVHLVFMGDCYDAKDISEGKYLENKKITFKFNGKKYVAKTNKKGVAKVTIKSKVLKKLKVGKKVTYQATYLKDTVKNTAKIKK